MNLLIDIGNTHTKLAVYSDKSEAEFRYDEIRIDDIKSIRKSYPELENVIVSTTAKENNELVNYCEEEFNTFINLSHKSQLPIELNYETPETLGKDRLATAVGANSLFPDTNVLIIDLGTAITIDFVNANNEFLGGNISPGVEMRFKAMHELTANLPLLKKNKNYGLTGQNTNNAIIFGVQTGILFEIQRYIEVYGDKYDDLKTILTGGNSNLFEKELKNCIFAVPNLIFEGLNKILLHNV